MLTALVRVGAAVTNYHKPDGSKQKELFSLTILEGSQVALVVKNPPANARDVRDVGSIPGLGRSPRGGHGNLLQYSCLENSMDCHGVAKRKT